MDKKPKKVSSIQKKATKKTLKRVIPPQKSPTDISNWVDRPLATPSGRIVIETDQTDDGIVIAE